MDIPGYKIERELGRGGMATVYLAIQTSVERKVALKIMSPVLLVDPSFAERFTREARIAANLYHPHIVAVHDVGVHEEQPFIAMEHLAGGDLAARLAAGKVDVPFAARVVREIAAALGYAHEKGFVHRDVKPENILFRDDLTAVLTDFGIARAVNSATQMTRTGAVIGTPQYMSPEQARGRELDGRSDLYGLGIVFYELLTGRAPFRGNDSVAVGIMHVTEPVPALPGHVDFAQPVLDRFLAKHPADRFQSGAEAVEALRRLEAQLITGQSPRVEVPTPQPQNRTPTPPPTDPRRSTPPLDETTPLPVQTPGPAPAAARSSVSATPRPDGSLRQEPSLGSLDDLSSFDRTVSRPAFTPAELSDRPARKTAPPVRRRRGWAPLLLVALVAVAAAGWWQRDQLLAYLPDPEVDRLLERARAAYEYQHYYGDSQQYANRLYQRVLEIDPANSQARAGLNLLAETFVREFDGALARGDYDAAAAHLDRAEELAPALALVRDARGRLDRVLVATPPGTGETASPVADAPPEEPPPPSGPDPQLLVDEGRALLARGRLVGAGDDNALARFRAALAVDPDFGPARSGIDDIRTTLTADFRDAVAAGRLAAAEAALPALAEVADARALGDLRAVLTAARREAEQEAAAAAAGAALERLLRLAEEDLSADRLTRPASNNALARFREAAALAPGDPRPAAGIDRVAERLLGLAEIALENDRLDEAAEQIDTIAGLRPNLPGLERARNRLTLYRQQSSARELTAAESARLNALVADARAAMLGGDLMRPPGGSAYDLLKAALKIDPNSPVVEAGLGELAEGLLGRARDALGAGDLRGADRRLAEAQQTHPSQPGLREMQASIAAAYRAATREAITAGSLDEARELLLRASELAPDHEDLARLELALSIARDPEG